MRVESRQTACRRILVSALIVLVFVLALRAKLSLYDPPHAGSISPASASKLWVSSEKLKAVTGTLPVLWFAPLLFFVSPPRRVLAFAIAGPLIMGDFAQFELFRFLRPPPASY